MIANAFGWAIWVGTPILLVALCIECGRVYKRGPGDGKR